MAGRTAAGFVHSGASAPRSPTKVPTATAFAANGSHHLEDQRWLRVLGGVPFSLCYTLGLLVCSREGATFVLQEQSGGPS